MTGLPTGDYLSFPMAEQNVPESGTDSEPDHVDKLLDLAELICDEQSYSSYRQLALRAGLPLSTTHRLVTRLMAKGLCERSPRGQLVAGGRLVRMGLRALDRLSELRPAEDQLRALSRATGESASLGMLLGGRILLVARHESEQLLRVVVRVGDTLPPHRSALGKAVLAQLPPSQRLSVLQQALGRPASKVAAQLDEELASIRLQGYSVDEEQFAPGLRCRAAPVFAPTGTVLGAISISGPSARFSQEQADNAVGALQRACAQVSGYLRAA